MQCLGRQKSACDPRNLFLSDYLPKALPPSPDTIRWDTPVRVWGTQGNDRYGNCVICTAAHTQQTWLANDARLPDPIADDAVIDLSEEMGALNGYSILERNKWWRKNSMFGTNLWAFLTFNTHDADYHRYAIANLGCSDIGLALPAAWKNQETWSTGSGRGYRPGSWGLHSVPLIGYDADYFYCVTWGRIQAITHAALVDYSDEAWALLHPAWLGDDNRTPTGLDLTSLHAALRALAQ